MEYFDFLTTYLQYYLLFAPFVLRVPYKLPEQQYHDKVGLSGAGQPAPHNPPTCNNIIIVLYIILNKLLIYIYVHINLATKII